MKHIGDIPGLVLFIFFCLPFFFFPFSGLKTMCDSVLSNSLHHSQQERFILLEIKLPKINSRLFAYEKSVGAG